METATGTNTDCRQSLVTVGSRWRPGVISKSYPIYPVMCGIHTVQSVRIFESSSGHVFQDMLCYIR